MNGKIQNRCEVYQYSLGHLKGMYVKYFLVDIKNNYLGPLGQNEEPRIKIQIFQIGTSLGQPH